MSRGRVQYFEICRAAARAAQEESICVVNPCINLCAVKDLAASPIVILSEAKDLSQGAPRCFAQDKAQQGSCDEHEIPEMIIVMQM